MRLHILAALVPACLLAGCSANPDDGQDRIYPDEVTQVDEAPAPSAPALPENAIADSASLMGEYRVAGADGADIDLGHGISLSITEDTIALASQCVTPRWTYSFVEGRLGTKRIVEPICDRGRYPAEEAIMAVFDDPQQIVRTPANGIYITGGGHSVTLFSQ